MNSNIWCCIYSHRWVDMEDSHIKKKMGGFDMKSEEKIYVIYYFLGFQHTLIHFQYKEQIYFYIHDHRFRHVVSHKNMNINQYMYILDVTDEESYPERYVSL